MQLKKYLFPISIAFLFSSPIYASGFYLGGSLGSYSGTYDINQQVSNVSSRYKAGPWSVGVGALMGYGFNVGSGYWAAEFSATFTNEKASEKINLNPDVNEIRKLDVSTRNSFALDILPGYFITKNTMIYGRIGPVVTKFESDYDVSRNYVAYEKHSLSKTLAGAHVGLGFETFFSQHWGLRGEYVFSQYAKQSDAFTIKDYPYSTRNKYSLRNNQFNFEIVYHFGKDTIYSKAPQLIES